MDGMAQIPDVSGHARLRMAERYGHDLSDAAWMTLVEAILARRVVMVRHGRNGGEVYACPIGAMTVRVVWSPQHGVVMTVLPLRHRLPNLTSNARARGCR